jgi:hypothetical protein
MNSEKTFRIALFMSLLTHSVIFLNYPNLNFLLAHKRSENIQIVYLKNPPQPPGNTKWQIPDKEALSKISSRIKALDRSINSLSVNREGLFGKNKPIMLRDAAFIRPAIDKPDIIPSKKKISIPPVEMNKIGNNPSYVNYYQIVREKIRRAAYQNYSRTETGEIYLAFVIYAEGSLKEVKLIEEKSSANFFLRGIALRSIKDATPFPPFPKELDYPQLSFNVIISFEIE